MKLRLPALAISVAVALSACSATAPSADPAEQQPTAEVILESYGFGGLDARDVIDLLDRTPLSERPEGLVASVRPSELLVGDSTVSEPVPLAIPNDDFYLSIAPYVDSTHECYFHSLTSCVGELSDANVHLTVTDDATGEVLVDEATATFNNGFIATWLPRDIEATVTIAYGDKSAVRRVSTGVDDPTCVTDIQLR